MLFNTYLFAGCFLPLSLAGFALVRRINRTMAVIWLILASLIFYSWWNIAFLPVLLISIAGNFAASRFILATQGHVRLGVLTGAIVLNLAALVWYKYLPAFGIPIPQPALPLGISFFTFTQIAYLLDCHSGLEAARSPLDYTLFVTFFPHLIAGPIVSARDLTPGLSGPNGLRPTVEDFISGGTIFLIGLLKKTLLADPIASLAAPGFPAPEAPGFTALEALTLLPAWCAALAWPLQLYFDFSGYSDMAVGLARMFGVTFPFNFNAPYKATSVIEYWQRWHISLTRFLMSTLHTPLTLAVMRRRRAIGLKSDRPAQKTFSGFVTMLAVPILITMGLAGIWHGSGLTFLVFGLLHAAFLIINHAWRLWRPASLPFVWAGPAASASLTFLCVLAGATIFRAPTLGGAFTLFGAMAGANGVDLSWTQRGLMDAAWLAGLYAIIWMAPTTQAIVGETRFSLSLNRAAAVGIAAALGLLSIGGTSEFLYFQF